MLNRNKEALEVARDKITELMKSADQSTAPNLAAALVNVTAQLAQIVN